MDFKKQSEDCIIMGPSPPASGRAEVLNHLGIEGIKVSNKLEDFKF
jgi:hypothetical protein